METSPEQTEKGSLVHNYEWKPSLQLAGKPQAGRRQRMT